MQISSWMVMVKTYNWLFFLLACCQCRPGLMVRAQRFSHRTRLLDTDQVYKDRQPKIPPPGHYPTNNHHYPSGDPDNDNNEELPGDNRLYQETAGVRPSVPVLDQQQRRKFYHDPRNDDMELMLEDPVCTAPDSRKGSCYDAATCSERGGIPMGRCGPTKGHVCCLFEATCSQTVRERHVYFRNPGFPYPYDGSRICRMKINKIDGQNICQMRLSFRHFDIAKPIEGNCTQDTFLVSGQNENYIVPRICGYNTGQHYYIGVDESGMVTLQMVFRGSYPRKFDIHIEQIDCGSKRMAPAYCLQYYEGTQGTIKSFNYDSADEFGPNRQQDLSSIIHEGYPNNVDYMICIKKETGFCSISYEFMSDQSGAVLPFSVGLSQNRFFKRNGLQHGEQQQMFSTVQTTQCDDDYLIVSGTKVCTKIVEPGNDLIGGGGTGGDSPIGTTRSPMANPEDLITPGNITEKIFRDGGDLRNGDLTENGRETEVEELRMHHRRRRRRRSTVPELFDEIMTRRYRWMMTATPITLRQDSMAQRLRQNYVMTTDSTPGPFQLRFVSNSVDNAKGFYLAYRQNPCKM